MTNGNSRLRLVEFFDYAEININSVLVKGRFISLLLELEPTQNIVIREENGMSS